MIPDTQRYFRAEKGPEIFRKQIAWIYHNASSLDARFISHMGDVIEDAKGETDHPEWIQAEKFLRLLDKLAKEKGIPYSVSMGDHDYDGNEKPAMGRKGYVKRFGSKRYQNYAWYGGSSNTDTSHYQFFTANGRKYLHINLEVDAPMNTAFPDDEDQLKWAEKIIMENPGMPTIISTHAYITDETNDGKFYGHEPNPEVKKKNRRRGEDRRGGLDIWNELVKKHDQIFLTLSANYHEFNNRRGEKAGIGDTGEYYQISTNNRGREVVEIMANYQGYPNGGNGWFRILVFDEKKNAITVKTYSDFLKEFKKTNRETPRTSDFVIELDLEKRMQRAK